MFAIVIRYSCIENPDRVVFDKLEKARDCFNDMLAIVNNYRGSRSVITVFTDNYGTTILFQPEFVASISIQDIKLSLILNSDLQQLQAMEEIRFKQELGNKAALRGVDINAPRKM